MAVRDDDRSAALLERWQRDGDRPALEELLAIEIARLKERLRGRASPAPDPGISVSDVAQEAVMRMLALEQTPSFESPDKLRAYLWTAAWRLLLERLRRRGAPVLSLDAVGTQRLDGALATTARALTSRQPRPPQLCRPRSTA